MPERQLKLGDLVATRIEYSMYADGRLSDFGLGEIIEIIDLRYILVKWLCWPDTKIPQRYCIEDIILIACINLNYDVNLDYYSELIGELDG